MTEFLDAGKDRGFSDEELCFISGTLMEAGSDTTRISLHEVVAAAALYPDWVERARMQLDRVCGANGERLSVAQDLAQCPVIRGAVKESMRWKPTIAETGIPHCLLEDDNFEGYRVPLWICVHLESLGNIEFGLGVRTAGALLAGTIHQRRARYGFERPSGLRCRSKGLRRILWWRRQPWHRNCEDCLLFQLRTGFISSHRHFDTISLKE